MTEQLKPMTAHRAIYFMERFRKEEKLLGPNEQAAVAYVIAMLEAQDAQPAQAVPVLTDAEIRSAADACDDGQEDAEYTLAFGRKIESLVRSKLGAGVPMTPAELDKAMQAMFYPARNRAFMDGVRAAERHHGIVGKEGGNV